MLARSFALTSYCVLLTAGPKAALGAEELGRRMLKRPWNKKR